MEQDNSQEKLFTLGEMARLGLIKSKNTGGAIKKKNNLSVALRGANFTVVQTKYGPSKCLTQSQIDAYNAGITPRWKNKNEPTSTDMQ